MRPQLCIVKQQQQQTSILNSIFRYPFYVENEARCLTVECLWLMHSFYFTDIKVCRHSKLPPDSSHLLRRCVHVVTEKHHEHV